jgi:hypothetical protein
LPLEPVVIFDIVSICENSYLTKVVILYLGKHFCPT